jgi:hypothetical protein
LATGGPLSGDAGSVPGGVAAGAAAGGAAITAAAKKVELAMKAAMIVVRDAFMGDGSCSSRARPGNYWVQNAGRCQRIAHFGERWRYPAAIPHRTAPHSLSGLRLPDYGTHVEASP